MVAFAFGLLHRLGFAGALAEIGLPINAIPLALLTWLAKGRIGQARIATPAAYFIGGIASYWANERVVSFY